MNHHASELTTKVSRPRNRRQKRRRRPPSPVNTPNVAGVLLGPDPSPIGHVLLRPATTEKNPVFFPPRLACSGPVQLSCSARVAVVLPCDASHCLCASLCQGRSRNFRELRIKPFPPTCSPKRYQHDPATWLANTKVRRFITKFAHADSNMKPLGV